MASELWFLKRCDLFETLTTEEAGRLELRAVMRRFGKGERVYFPGDPGRSVLVPASGRVKIKGLAPDGKELILAFIDEGEVFGELALVDDSPRDEFAEAVEASEVLAIPSEDLSALMDRVTPEVSDGPHQHDGWRPCPPGEFQRLGSRLLRRRRSRLVVRSTVVVSLALLTGTLSLQVWRWGTTEHRFAGIPCSRVMALAGDYASGKLVGPLRTQVHDHVARCPRCKPMFRMMGVSVVSSSREGKPSPGVPG